MTHSTVSLGVGPYTAASYIQYCQEQFNITPDFDKYLQLNAGLNTSSNIIFSNGGLDPWHTGMSHRVTQQLLTLRHMA